MFDAGAIVSRLELEKGQWEKAIKEVKADSTSFQGAILRNDEQIKKMGKSLTITGVAITGVSVLITKLAMDAQESENLFKESMGGMAGAAEEWSKELSSSLGLNQYEIRKTVGTFNVMLDSMGMTEDAAFGMSKGLTQLSYDMASFYNLKPEEAFQKLQAAISGEAEPLKRLGIIVNETTIQTWALNNGLIKQGETMTEAQKVAARYGTIMEQTAKAQGDLERTSTSLTNLIRRMGSVSAELGVTLGQALLPVISKVTEYLVIGIIAVNEWVKEHQYLAKAIVLSVAAFGALALAIGPLLMMLPSLTAGWVILSQSALLPFLVVGAKVALLAGVVYFAFKKWDLLKATFWAFSAGLNEALSSVTINISKYMDLLAKIPGAQSHLFNAASVAMRAASEEFAKNADFSLAKAQEGIAAQEKREQEYIENTKSEVKGLEDVYSEMFKNIEAQSTTSLTNMTESQKLYVSGFLDNMKSMLSQFGLELELTLQEIDGQMQYSTELVAQRWQIVFQEVSNVIRTIQTGLTNTIYNLVTGAKNLDQVWKEVGKSILRTVIDMLVKIMTQNAIMWTMNLLGIKSHITSRMGSLAAETYGAAFASTAAIPIVGPILAPGVAAASTATMLSGAVAQSVVGGAVGAGLVAVPALAEGGDIVKGGRVLVGDGGEPEVVDLPTGARVTPLSKLGEGGMLIKFYNYGDIHTEADEDAMVQRLANKIDNAMRGML